MKETDLILALFLYIDEHESPLLWIASLRALGHIAGPRSSLINNANYRLKLVENIPQFDRNLSIPSSQR